VPGAPRKKTRGVPGEGNRDAEGTPHEPGQSPALHSDGAQRAGRRGRFAAGSKERTAVLAGLKPFPQGLKPLKAKHVMSELKLRPPKTQEPALTEARMERTQKQVPLWVRDDRGWRRSSMGGRVPVMEVRLKLCHGPSTAWALHASG
jgi:hypothetical protein